MAEVPVEAVVEEKRREAVRAIADAGTRAQSAGANTARSLASAGRAAIAPRDPVRRDATPGGLAEELARIVQPAIDGNRAWAGNNSRFEAGQTADMTDSAGRFFAGASSAVPIVRAGADAARAGNEASALNSILQQELGVGQSGFNFRQALEGQAWQRESQEFERASHADNMALAAEQLAFEQEKLRQLQEAAAPPSPTDVFNETWMRRFGRPLTRG